MDPETRSIRLFSLAGVPVRMHPVVLMLIGLLLIYQFAAQDPGGHVSFLLGGIGEVLMAVLAHELGHALVARRLRLPVADITLNVFYAVTRTAPPRTPNEELLVAAGGPAASLLVAGCVQLVRMLAPVGSDILDELLRNALLINGLLGLANLLPAFPMDGGRILRALLERRSDHLRATRRAVIFSRVLSLSMIAAPLAMPWGALSIGLPIIGVVVLVLGEQELRRAGQDGPE